MKIAALERPEGTRKWWNHTHDTGPLASLIDIVSTSCHVVAVLCHADFWVLRHSKVAFAEDDDLVARNVVLLQRLADDFF